TAKLDLICRKLGLRPGQRLLDVGCGWGGLVRHAAEHYGVSAVGITLSAAQAEVARERCAGLPVAIRLQDYRDVHATFDRAASVGMFEHIGARAYPGFFDKMRRCLAPDGLLVLHTIGGLRSNAAMDPWIETYIFPDSQIPSARQLAAAIEGRFVIEDW